MKTGISSKAKTFISSFLIVAFIAAIGYFALQLLNKNMVTFIFQSNKVEGNIFQASQTGMHEFTYTDGAYSGYGGAVEQTWNTLVVVYQGDEPLWSGNDLNYSVTASVFGGAGYSSRETAIEATRGLSFHIQLNEGDIINLIAGDNKDSYGDNAGEIEFSVSVTN